MRGKRIMVIVGIALASFVAGVSVKMATDYHSIQQGVKALKAMYEFKNIDELAANTEALKKVTTEEIYNKLTVESADKALSVYLRLHKDPCNVQIVEAVPGSIKYTINAPTLAMGRMYLFNYELNYRGKIKKSYEGEIIPFPYDRVEIEIPEATEDDYGPPSE